MKWEYMTADIRDGGEDNYQIQVEMDQHGAEGWEFCEWVDEHWNASSGPGPCTREALFKRPAERTGAEPR